MNSQSFVKQANTKFITQRSIDILNSLADK